MAFVFEGATATPSTSTMTVSLRPTGKVTASVPAGATVTSVTANGTYYNGPYDSNHPFNAALTRSTGTKAARTWEQSGTTVTINGGMTGTAKINYTVQSVTSTVTRPPRPTPTAPVSTPAPAPGPAEVAPSPSAVSVTAPPASVAVSTAPPVSIVEVQPSTPATVSPPKAQTTYPLITSKTCPQGQTRNMWGVCAKSSTPATLTSTIQAQPSTVAISTAKPTAVVPEEAASAPSEIVEAKPGGGLSPMILALAGAAVLVGFMMFRKGA